MDVVGKVFEAMEIRSQGVVRLKFDQDPTGTVPSGVTSPYFGVEVNTDIGRAILDDLRLAMEKGWAVWIYGSGAAVSGTAYEAIQCVGLYP